VWRSSWPSRLTRRRDGSWTRPLSRPPTLDAVEGGSGDPSDSREQGFRHGNRRGQTADARGRVAENAAADALERDGWNILARRLRTSAGEIDMLAEKAGLLAIVEVKARPTLMDAATALSMRQQARLIAAAEIVLATHPHWGIAGVRFDMMLVDAGGVVRRIADAFRGNG
jgi:putative endonuclease